MCAIKLDILIEPNKAKELVQKFKDGLYEIGGFPIIDVDILPKKNNINSNLKVEKSKDNIKKIEVIEPSELTIIGGKPLTGHETSYGSGLFFLNKRTLVYANEITLLEADVNYTKVYFEKGATKIFPIALKKIEPLLKESGFLRIHKKFLLNLNFADNFKINDEMVTLKNNVVIRVSRRRRNILKRILKEKKK